MSRFFTALVASLVALTIGCEGPRTFRVKTRILADGRCEREILQPAKVDLPPEALTPEWKARWQSVEPAMDPLRIRRGLASKNEKPTFFHAKGVFAKASEIPTHYRHYMKEDRKGPAGEILLEHGADDFVLFTEHRWTERVTNTSSDKDFEEGVPVVWQWLCSLALSEAKKEFADMYDFTALEAYMFGDGERLVMTIAREMRTMAINGSWNTGFSASTLATARDQGLDLEGISKEVAKSHDDATHRGNKEDPTDRLLFAWFAKYIRHRDGSPVTVEELIESKKRLSNSEQAKKVPDNLPDSVVAALAHVLGLYQDIGYIFGGAPHFEFSITLPGRIVETNGLIVDGNRVVWRFGPEVLYPIGKTMTARCFVINEDAQKDLFGKVALDNPVALNELADSLRSSPSLLAAMRRARKEKNFAPMFNLTTNDRRAVAALPRVRQLLEAARVRSEN